MAAGISPLLVGVVWVTIYASSRDPRYTERGKARLVAAGFGPLFAGLGGVTGFEPLVYLGAFVILAAISDRLITKTPTRLD